MKISNLIKKTNAFDKIFFLLSIGIILYILMNYNNSIKEGFEENKEFITKTNVQVYDKFYVDLYDMLFFSNIKNDFEIGEIVNSTKPNSESLILDIGSGTGHHVNSLNEQDIKTIGIDISPAMIEYSKKTYPNWEYKLGDASQAIMFNSDSFTHITCLYFTIYYIKDKERFFNNCYNWLSPGGNLILHLVDRDSFDPIVPAGDPFTIVSPQKYAKNRITSSNVKFNNMHYKANFEYDKKNNISIMRETFKPKNSNKIRQNEHKLYMPTQKQILTLARNAGFILINKSNMVSCEYNNQYLYVLQKPN